MYNSKRIYDREEPADAPFQRTVATAESDARREVACAPVRSDGERKGPAFAIALGVCRVKVKRSGAPRLKQSGTA